MTRPDAADRFATWPPGWYVVARSTDLRRNSVLTGVIAGRPYVAFRTAGGALAVVDAHCPHMGAHLQHARVEGEHLVCPLHRFGIDVRGDCRGAEGAGAFRTRPWDSAERFGLVFVHVGAGPPPAPPAPGDADAFAWTTSRPTVLATAWHSLMVNAFDLLHFRSVHHREFVEEPQLERLADGALQLTYVSRVTGRGLGDRAMKWISGNRIHVRQICRGPTMVVESDLGRTRTAGVMGLLPDGDGVRAFGAFGVRRDEPLVGLRRAVARWLFLDFLKRDFAIVQGMRLRVDDVPDRGVAAAAEYFASLPDLSRA